MPSLLKIREENIKRNDEFLTSLGLNDVKPVVNSGNTPQGICRKRERKREREREEGDDESYSDSDLSSGDEDDEVTLKSKRKRRRKKEMEKEKFLKKYQASSSQAVRRSSRNAGILPTRVGVANVDIDIKDDDDDDDNKRKKITSSILINYIKNANRNHYDIIENKTIAHTVDRITSMSDKALKSRINIILKAKGKYCYEKLLSFYYGLLVANITDAAEECNKAVKQLEIEMK